MRFAEIFSTLLLLGTLQGLILSGMLFFGRRSRPGKLLGTLILLMTLCCLNLYLSNAPWFNADPLLPFLANFVPLILAMPLGPLLYFYVRASLDPGFRVGRRQRRHFFPVVIDLVPQLTAFLYIGGLISGLISSPPEPWGRFIDTYNVYADIPRWLSLTTYLWLSARYLGRVKDARPEHLRWIRQFIRFFLAFQLIWLLYLVPYVIPRLTDGVLSTLDWYPVYIPLVILIYGLGMKGYLATPRPGAETPKAPAPLQAGVVDGALPRLKKAMEVDRLYLEPALNLAALSGHTGLSAKTISAVLNQHMQKNFNEFVNEYRIAAVKRKLREQEQDHLTILGIALESGFNSQATFQRAFRQRTGMSPSEYLKRVKMPLKSGYE